MSRATSSNPLPSLHLRHSSLPNPYVALPTSQLILQSLLSLLLRHRLFTYVSWRAAHVSQIWEMHFQPVAKYSFKTRLIPNSTEKFPLLARTQTQAPAYYCDSSNTGGSDVTRRQRLFFRGGKGGQASLTFYQSTNKIIAVLVSDLVSYMKISRLVK